MITWLVILNGETIMDLIKFTPVFKEKIWGGTKLKSEFGYDICGKKVGECWGVSAHPAGDVTVDGGEFNGLKLSELWDTHPELFGNPAKGSKFPLLTKIIDAEQDLSIQVHPDDRYAMEHEDSFGKTECWYILTCDEDAEIVIGHNAKTKDELRQMIDENRWDELLRREQVHPGDFFYIAPGTIHSIKGGIMLLETQQSSDVTYRLYDYDRLSDDGEPRELHLKESFDVIKAPYDPMHLESNVQRSDNAWFRQLEAGEFFTVWKARMDGEEKIVRDQVFLIGTCIEGSATIGDTEVKKGDHFIIPGGGDDLVVKGTAKFVFSAPA